MGRRRIALLCGQPEEYCQELFIKGFNKVALAADIDVCVFAMYQKYQDSPEREISDSSIFDMINYPMFDGVVVMADTIQTPGVLDRIDSKIKSTFKGKVLVIESESDVFPYELQDNYYPIKKLISHLIEVHNYTDIAFLTGKKWHPHSKKRLQAYIDTMEEHGLEVREDRIFYGDFWYTSGESVAERLTKSNVVPPQAIACANDAMAIGVAKTLIAKGIKVPEQIAVIGYDSNEEGKHAPVPLTSADIPLFAFGEHSAEDMISILDGGEVTPFVSDADLFIGGTCGCNCDSVVPSYEYREQWNTQTSDNGVFSVFNHMNEDLIDQANFSGLINTIFSYIYQIRPFDLFSLCINNNWEVNNDGFSDRMIQVIKSGDANTRDHVNLDETFALADMLPELSLESDKAKVYFFMPFTNDGQIFGYSVIAYKDPLKCVDEGYRIWLRSCMIGFEILRRSDDAVKTDIKVQDGLVKDNLTGLCNYQGLLNRGPTIIDLMQNRGGFLSVLAIDIKDLSNINERYGRAVGDKVIVNTASMLDSLLHGFEYLTVCLGNGEFIAIKVTSSSEESEMLSVYDQLKEKIRVYNADPSVEVKINLYYGIMSGKPDNMTDLERLINTAISKKNSNKISVMKAKDTGLSSEEEEVSIRVNEIIESNRLNYHFQPIVRTTDGEIFAYEALMRPDSTPYITPPDLLHYADISGRLADVEKETFFNVLDIVERRKDVFDGSKKVFINSIPGQTVSDEDRAILTDRIRRLDGAVVVELTEQSELSDEELEDLKRLYLNMGVNTAVDDYGTGYSNVTNLLRYMPKYVKIDRMLLSGIQDSPQKQHFVKDIISFSHDNGIMALAEGVETPEELQTVILLGADLVQGFYTARPRSEIVSSIDPQIKKEIRNYRINYEESNSGKVHVAGREGRIMLPRLSEQGIETISVSRTEATFIDFTVAGSPDYKANIGINITNGYKGRITLENAGFGVDGPAQAISIDSESEVTLVIKGDNRLVGGIRVAEGSVLRIEGDGTLHINTSYIDCYGIGNVLEAKHGDIFVEDFDGLLDISINGVTGCAIGSGLGGKIVLSSGHIVINAPGRKSVAIGNIRGYSDINIMNAEISFKIYSMACTGIGSGSGKATVKIENAKIISNIEGKNAMVFGDINYKSKFDIRSTKVISTLKSELMASPDIDRTKMNFLMGEVTFDAEGNRIS